MYFKKCTQYILFKLIISLTWVCSWVLLMITEKKKHYKIFIWVHSGIASNEVIFMQQPWQFTLDVHGLKLQAIMRLWGQWWKNQQKMKKNKRSRRGAGCPSLSKPGSFPVFLIMALPNEKPNTLHSAFIVGVHFRMGSFWPWHMAPQKTTAHWEYWRCFHACGSCPRQALVITFIIAVILFFVWMQRSPWGLSGICAFHPLLIFLLPLSKWEKRKTKKQEKWNLHNQLPINAPLLSFSIFSFHSSTFLSATALRVWWPAFSLIPM